MGNILCSISGCNIFSGNRKELIGGKYSDRKRITVLYFNLGKRLKLKKKQKKIRKKIEKKKKGRKRNGITEERMERR